MPEPDDIALLKEYAESGSEAAFTSLVGRHVNLVYSAALRSVGNAHAAQEIAQAVFIILARKAKSLGGKTVLSGWLYQTARLTAANYSRTEIRRQNREQETYMQTILNEPESEAWRQIAPLLDDAMGRLGAKDRDAIVLRFFENKNLREVGLALGASEDAAKMRVNRALEKLRKIFAKRGVTHSAAIIAGAVSANSVHAAPVGLAKTISTVALAKGVAASTSTLTLIKGALKIMAWTKAKTAIVSGVAVLLAAGTTTITVKEIAHHREESVWSHITRCDLKQMESAPPAVSIRPTRFTRNVVGQSQNGEGKVLGLHVPFDMLLARAYDTTPCRVLALTPLPQGDFDFIANVPQRQKEALQEMIRQKFGITARRETRETDVLLLTVRRRGSPGLKPTPSTTRNDTSSADVGHLKSANRLIDSLIDDLQYYLQVPVVDRTGLAGRFDIDLKWNDQMKWDDAGRCSISNPDGLKQALLDQLGLELVPSREPVEMLVVEK